MKKIALSGSIGRGKHALVDDDIYDKYGAMKWNLRKKSVSRNVMRGGKQHTEILSRIIVDAPSGYWVDHINGNILDNRRENLRLCKPIQNSWNKSTPQRNTSGYKGVSYKKKQNKYYAYITVRGDIKHLGVYSDAISAAIAYNNAAKTHYGEYAKLNYIDIHASI